MAPMLHSGIANLVLTRLIRRTASLSLRSLSSVAAIDEKAVENTDPEMKEEEDLLHSLDPMEPDAWRETESFLEKGIKLESPESRNGSDYWREKRDRQLRLEQNFVYEAIEQHRRFIENVTKQEKAAALPFARQLLVRWLPALTESIKAEQRKILRKSAKDVKSADKYIMLLGPDELAVLTIHVVLGCLLKNNLEDQPGRLPFTTVAMRLGKAVQTQINLLKLKHRQDKNNRRRAMLGKYVESLKGQPTSTVESLDLPDWEKRLIKRAIAMDFKLKAMKNRWNERHVSFKEVVKSTWVLGKEQIKWDEPTTAQIGGMLINLFKDSALVTINRLTGKFMGAKVGTACSNEYALKHEIIWKTGSKGFYSQGILSIHPCIINIAKNQTAHWSVLMNRTYPMVYPPERWRSFDAGGYLSTPTRVMRSFDHAEPIQLIKQADALGNMEQIYNALTVLGNTAWKLNKEIFEVIEKVWNEGGGTLGLPTRGDVPLPPNPAPFFKCASVDGVLQATVMEETPVEELYRLSDVYKANKKNAELHSLRCDTELKLNVARRFLDEDRIYFPHNMDFRGRAYPIPPHLNHLGNDMCRGLLLFADTKPLGEKGLDWLYIQVANLYGAGQNKKSMKERLQFGFENLDKVLDSANNPIGGLQWWMEADSPWQLLATCMEIRNALSHDSPEEYESNMHVHQDGSCNGLQHYAALARDTLGAGAVNLRPTETPNDVYSEVARIVERIVNEDAAKGKEEAQVLKGHVDRKLVKQTVMTSVYGVTFIGAREQISNRLRERGWDDENLVFSTSRYAAKVTMEGLHEMFHNAKDVMHWLAECAGKIGAANEIVKWTTPLGLPVGQPYRSKEKYAVKTVLQTVTLLKGLSDMPVSKKKQRSAFPPNYIHSLDSTHMMMTALGCDEKGIAFAGVHDSFWTHAGTVDDLNRILRQKFYELHSQPLMEQLLEQFRETYDDKALEFPPVPQVGDFDLGEILNADYFFN